MSKPRGSHFTLPERRCIIGTCSGTHLRLHGDLTTPMTNNWNRKETNASPSENKPRRSANLPESPPQKRASLISFIGQKVQKTVDERADAKQNQKAAHAARAEQAGNLITRGQFGCHYIEIYENGYVRIAASQDELKGAFMTKIAPFEKLLAFSFSEESGTKKQCGRVVNKLSPPRRKFTCREGLESPSTRTGDSGSQPYSSEKIR